MKSFATCMSHGDYVNTMQHIGIYCNTKRFIHKTTSAYENMMLLNAI